MVVDLCYEVQCLKKIFFPTWTVSAHWANDERTLNERWAHAEGNLVNADQRWTMSERRTQTKRKLKGERFVNVQWTI